MSLRLTAVVFFISLCCLARGADAFGAGNIPSYGYLEGKSYRHGDIEDFLEEIAYKAGGFLGISLSGSKFSKLMVKRVYFGNWLRDYSQAVDVATLSKGLSNSTLRLIVWVMSILSFSYATNEFEVTVDRLGVYRPEEHIDNPKGYAEGDDARRYDRRLRGPVSEAELQIDPRTGMKNYIANDRGNWMTSSALLRQTFSRCIQLGRAGGAGKDNPESFEALRLLGQGLHTLEDFSAHSNYVELCLIELGYKAIFAHVGARSQVRVQGKTMWPLTTGTFGGLDFVHSLLGEASDHLSQTQITELSSSIGSSQQNSRRNSAMGVLRSLISSVPGSSSLGIGSRDLDEIEDRSRSMQRSSRNAGEMDPEEIIRMVYPLLEFRDKILKFCDKTLDKLGLADIVENITDTVTVFVLSEIGPFITPLLSKVSGALSSGSSLVTSTDAQFEVFEHDHSSDPTHSMLSKDHFSCYLNEPAGRIAVTVLKFAAEKIVAAWSDDSIDPRQVVEEIVQVFHHPALFNRNIEIQSAMFNEVKGWLDGLGHRRDTVLSCLTKEAVKEGRHHAGDSGHSHGSGQLPFKGHWQHQQGQNREVGPGSSVNSAYQYNSGVDARAHRYSETSAQYRQGNDQYAYPTSSHQAPVPSRFEDDYQLFQNRPGITQSGAQGGFTNYQYGEQQQSYNYGNNQDYYGRPPAQYGQPQGEYEQPQGQYGRPPPPTAPYPDPYSQGSTSYGYQDPYGQPHQGYQQPQQWGQQPQHYGQGAPYQNQYGGGGYYQNPPYGRGY